MVLPEVASLMVTLCADAYVPAAGLNVGVAVAVGEPPEETVQLLTSWIAVSPPGPPVKPKYPVLLPIVEARLIGQECVKVPAVTVSVSVIVRLVPSLVICALMTWPL